MFTRRRFLQTLPALAAVPPLANQLAAHAAQAQSFTLPQLRKKPLPPPPPTFVYFGTDTSAGAARGIYLSRFDPASGRLSPAQLIAQTLRPSFLALSPPTSSQQRRLYAVNAVPDPSATVSSFAVNAATGALRPINQVTSAGAGPCYVSVDATGHSAFVANYNGSTIATYSIRPDGSLSEPVVRIDYKDRKFGTRGPNAARQDVPHPHSVHLSPDNRFLLVNDLGSDEISVFAADAETARLGPPALFSNDRPGSGPRHIAFHPNGRWLYSINELDSTIDHFLWTTTSSRTDPKGLLINTDTQVSTIAPNFPAAKNTAAEVAIASDGNFLYASNRGEDSLVVFAIAETDGALTFVQRISCGGKTPRHFTLSSEGEERWLLCGNQDSGTVTVFRRDGGTGRIGGPIQTLPVPSPMFSLFA
jgi:6-phosphogluconolactonase